MIHFPYAPCIEYFTQPLSNRCSIWDWLVQVFELRTNIYESLQKLNATRTIIYIVFKGRPSADCCSWELCRCLLTPPEACPAWQSHRTTKTCSEVTTVAVEVILFDPESRRNLLNYEDLQDLAKKLTYTLLELGGMSQSLLLVWIFVIHSDSTPKNHESTYSISAGHPFFKFHTSPNPPTVRSFSWFGRIHDQKQEVGVNSTPILRKILTCPIIHTAIYIWGPKETAFSVSCLL